MQFAKLMDDEGRQIQRPRAVDGSVSWSIAEGKAHAWAADGKTLLAELAGAWVVWLGATGLRVEGLRRAAWQLIFRPGSCRT